MSDGAALAIDRTAAIAGAPRRTAVPAGWADLWGRPEEQPARIGWARLRRISRELAAEVQLLDATEAFERLVGSDQLRSEPVHRWFSYKEGFSPRLLSTVITALGLQGELRVVDAFGGVATTALSGLVHPQVAAIRGVEYSPFAHFVGRTKLQSTAMDAQRVRRLLPRALAYDHKRSVSIPALTTFHNPEIFSPGRIRTLLRVRDHLRELPGSTQAERDFFLLGLAAVTEDLSGAMKDGRALRIKRGRTRRPSSLATTEPELVVTGKVKRALAGQWTAMLADLDQLESTARIFRGTETHHLTGDARHLREVVFDNGRQAFPDGWANLGLFSPPYLNCIDYTEVYKLELWLMEHITSASEFRQARLGTLRSHPSVQFAERNYLDNVCGPVIELIHGMAVWVQEQGARSEVGPVIRQYFEDMLQVWREQHRVLAPGSHAVCVVANSTFSRRRRTDGGARQELWRMPLLTDVVLAHLALEAGFESVEIWQARELRPRNVSAGNARESLVVARKAS